MRLKTKINKLHSKRRLIKCSLIVIIINIIIYIKYIGFINERNSNNTPNSDNTPYKYVQYYNCNFSNNINKTDWHDHKLMMEDISRIGLGEQGKAAFLPQNETLSKKESQKQISTTGYNARLSDRISFSRSLPDIRNDACKTKQYLSELPNASIIIVFFNEHWSILLRGVHSVINRSPEKLLNEIILVDDLSDKDYLVKKLDNYIAQNLPKVKLIRLKQRRGLIGARLTGAKAATGDVLVFFDAHMETNYNLLPPLLEPIAYNPKVVVGPLIDTIRRDTFRYFGRDEGRRGGFDWRFNYYRFPVLEEDLIDPTKPFRNPVLQGNFIVINRKWFWELGGFDPELDIWGGEQFELSFKVWMCGGEILEAPCSRAGNVYGSLGAWSSKIPRSYDFVRTNYKRVAEVWMDEYGQQVYQSDVDAYSAAETGDLSDRKALRKRLNCKSFKWYLENIAFDSLESYPPVSTESYAYGIVQSLADKTLCLDSLRRHHGEIVGLYQCTEGALRGNASNNQNWEISWQKDLKLRNARLCLDAAAHHEHANIFLSKCHNARGNQCWYYDHEKKYLVQGLTGYCLEANIKYQTVYINLCNETNINMKWEFGSYNATRLKRFYIDWPTP